MSNALVLYKSKYGATKRYAEMLAEELSCRCWEIDSCRESDPDKYDRVIFSGGIYAGGISGLRIFQKKFRSMDCKKVIILCVGASPYDEGALNEIREHNLKGSLKDVPLFYGRGAWDESKMNPKDRMLCKMLQKAAEKSKDDSCEPWIRALLSASGKSCDWTDKEYLLPLISFIISES